MLYTLQQMAHHIGATYIGHDVPFQGLSIDTRTIQPGECFLCIKGPHFDGHEFVKQAIEKGASAIITERPLSSGVPEIVVVDTLRALGHLAKLWRSQFNIPVIALTGSCGKTGTRNMMVTILSRVGNVVTSNHNYNNIYGLPLSLLKMKPEHQFAVFELGTNSRGEIGAITEICNPTIALILNIRGFHLQGLGSIEGVSEEKSDIFLGLGENGIAVINLDEPFHTQWSGKIGTHQRVTFSTHTKADITAHNIKMQLDGVEFEAHTTLGHAHIKIPLLGEHVVSNALAAITCCLAAGAQLSDAAQAFMAIAPVKGRLEPFRLNNGTLLINDTYNASPASVENAIKALATYSGKRIFVMTHMVELADYAAEYHTQMGQWTKQHNIDHVLLMGDEKLTRSALSAAGPRANYFETQEEIVERLLNLMDENTTVLVKGARSCKMEKVVAALLEKVNHVTTDPSTTH